MFYFIFFPLRCWLAGFGPLMKNSINIFFLKPSLILMGTASYSTKAIKWGWGCPSLWPLDDIEKVNGLFSTFENCLLEKKWTSTCFLYLLPKFHDRHDRHDSLCNHLKKRQIVTYFHKIINKHFSTEFFMSKKNCSKS